MTVTALISCTAIVLTQSQTSWCPLGQQNIRKGTFSLANMRASSSFGTAVGMCTQNGRVSVDFSLLQLLFNFLQSHMDLGMYFNFYLLRYH